MAGFIDRWIDLVWRRACVVIAATIAALVAAVILIATNLGFNLDNKTLLDPDLPFQQAMRDFERHFPSLVDSLLVVIDAETPELCRSAAAALVERLSAEPELFRDVYAPATLPFFARNVLLYRSTDDLGEFGDRIAEMQPVLAEMEQEPTVASLARIVRLGLEHQQDLGAAAGQWATVLDGIGDATVEMYQEFPIAVSWEEVMLSGSGLDSVTRQVVVVEPVLEFSRLLAADAAISHIRETARELGLTPERGVSVRITGNPALNRDEMRDLAEDIGIGGLFSFVLIIGVLFLALRATGLVVATLATLIAGLVLTAAFAAVAVGSLNLVSVTFGLLFIGLGVDFPLHFGMHYAEAFRAHKDPEAAAQRAARDVAGSLALCALTTAIGFLAFVPTDYLGVSELGLISSGGMVIILVLSLTLYPALLRTLAPAPASPPWFGLALAPAGLAARYPKITVAAAALAGVAAVAAVPQLRFDSDVIGLRNPQTESVVAFRDLLQDAAQSPWTADVVTPNLATADALAERLRTLDVVGKVVTASDYVPADQEEKRLLLEDAAFLLDTPPPTDAAAEEVSVAEQIDALRALHDVLEREHVGQVTDRRLRESVAELKRELDHFLDRVAGEPDPAAALAELEDVLLGNFPEQLERLNRALRPDEVTVETLPRQIRSRLLAADGTARVQVFPADRLHGSERLERFVDAVREVAPMATGVAVNLVAFGRATWDSMTEALTWAAVAIAILLGILLRRVGDALLVLAPVTLGAALTTASMVVLGIDFNFVNVVVLPLLLGVGVDSGIHLVRRSRAGADTESLPQTTATAVFYSALTTIVGFGSLGLSDHVGVASMGLLLVIGMLFMLVGNLVVLPALLRLVLGPER